MANTGSSVATSLCEGEAKAKHIGLLKVKLDPDISYCINPIKLQTVRPFIYKVLALAKIVEAKYCMPNADGIFEYIDDYIENTIFPLVQELLTGLFNRL